MSDPRRLIIALHAVLLVVSHGRAEVALPKVLGDHMVLQSGIDLPIWGTAEPGESITIRLGRELQEIEADANGDWLVKFSAREASAKPLTMVVKGANSITIRDVLVGELWLCAGQSNMEWPLKQAATARADVPQADHPQIRLLNLRGAARGGPGPYGHKQLARLTPDRFCEGRWSACSPKSAADFSAVGYYFGQQLYRELKVPIGLISPAIGGTPIEAWIRREALAADPTLNALVAGNWLDNEQIEPWCRKRAKANLRRALETDDDVPGDDLGPNHSFKPAFMWEAGIKPLRPLPFRGVIWYQGESNAESLAQVRRHGELFPLLVRDWRSQWGLGDFPFLFVQLPALDRPHWPAFRNQQLRFLRQLDRVGMAVTIDVGHPTDVHPPQKRQVGQRLARWALGTTYERDIVYSGPLYRQMRRRERSVVVDFDHVGSGLASRDDKDLVGFEVAGSDGNFQAAAALIEKDSVVVSSRLVTTPRTVRYAWAPFPRPAPNLVNREGLPASPFQAP